MVFSSKSASSRGHCRQNGDRWRLLFPWSAQQAYLYFRALPKTLLFNAYYFGWRGLFRLPVIISHRVRLARLSGRVYIAPHCGTAQIRIGFGNVGLFDPSRSRSIWENEGAVHFLGSARIGHGSKLSVASVGELIFGDGFSISAQSAIRCAKRIEFGAGCLISWDCLIIDQDFHPILDESGRITNPDREVRFGDRVWICCRALVLKGVSVGNDCVIAAGSVVTKSFPSTNLLIGGNPGAIMRRNISWHAGEIVTEPHCSETGRAEESAGRSFVSSELSARAVSVANEIGVGVDNV